MWSNYMRLILDSSFLYIHTFCLSSVLHGTVYLPWLCEISIRDENKWFEHSSYQVVRQEAQKRLHCAPEGKREVKPRCFEQPRRRLNVSDTRGEQTIPPSCPPRPQPATMRPPILAPSLRRLQSTSSTINLPSLASRLTTTRLPLIYDYLTPQPSHLLSLSLASFLPPSCSPSTAYTHPAPSIPLPSTLEKIPMPIAHHLVYFPPQVPTSYLLPDGTDALHSPGPPFNRRMWAGGSVRFFQSPGLDGRRAVCVEGIRDVNVKGKQGEEKVFVGVERRVAGVEEGEEEEGIRRRVWAGREEEGGDAVVVERRNLVFMRDRTGVEQEKEKEKERAGRIVKGRNLHIT